MIRIRIIEGYRAYEAYEAYGVYRAYRALSLIICSLLFATAFTACSSGSEDELLPGDAEVSGTTAETPVNTVSIPVEVKSMVSDFQDDMPVTRDWLPPTGYALLDNSENVIGVSFTDNVLGALNGHLFKVGDEWRTNVQLDEGTYYLYGYVPHTTGIGYDISPVGLFSSGAVMTLTNVPSIMPTDFCVVIGAKNGRDDYKKDEDYSVTDLRRGNFAYAAAKISEDGGGDGNFIYLLFDHLYAGMNLHLRVHGDYDGVRTIKLKNIELQASSNDTPTKEKTTVQVTLAANDGSTNPITNVTFTPTGATDVKTSIFKSQDGHTLTTDYQPFSGYFMPKGVTKVFLTCTYDVYDKNITPEHPDGNLVRQSCKATNAIQLADLFDRFDEMRSGMRYNIYLTIQPTYLYVMSDEDLNNPGMVVE